LLNFLVEMKKNILIYFILLISFNFVLAEEINISYPLNVSVGEVFEVNLSLINFTEDSYDVKIDMLNGGSHIIQRYWEEEWKSGNYYMSEAINISNISSGNFKVNITEDYSGNNSLIIKLRDSDNNIDSFEYPINISLTYNDSDSGNSSGNESNSGGDDNSEELIISYNISWKSKDIVNGDRFYVNFEVFNLKNKSYDIKMWIENENKVITDRYDKKNKEWKSGTYYINGFINGSGNVSSKIKLRIREGYEDFNGSTKIYFRIRDIGEIINNITIKKKIIIPDSIKIDEDNKTKITGNVVKKSKTGVSESIKSDENIIYESNSEMVRKYSVYIFSCLSLLLTVLVLWRKI